MKRLVLSCNQPLAFEVSFINYQVITVKNKTPLTQIEQEEEEDSRLLFRLYAVRVSSSRALFVYLFLFLR